MNAGGLQMGHGKIELQLNLFWCQKTQLAIWPQYFSDIYFPELLEKPSNAAISK